MLRGVFDCVAASQSRSEVPGLRAIVSNPQGKASGCFVKVIHSRSGLNVGAKAVMSFTFIA
jgi:hypothetical protein